MTDDQRNLAEWVARWAGWRPAAGITRDTWENETGQKRVGVGFVLSDLALAWRAQEELIEEVGYKKAMHEVDSYMCGQGCTRIEATHRARRAANGGE